MNEIILLFILGVHFLADFVFQTHEQAQKKNTSFKWLISHTGLYTYIWWIFGAFYIVFNLDTYIPWHLTYFCFITFVCHTITDYFTSKASKRYFLAGNYHNGFVVIGFDQILHYIQLYITFKLLLI